MNLIIDVSKHNGVIDWDIAKDNIKGAIIRIGHGGDFTEQDDPQAIRNMQECERLNIPYGVYLYSYALCNGDAESEVAHTLRMINDYNPTLGVWFDMEDADGYKKAHGLNPYNNRQEITNFCNIFCSKIMESGYNAGIYASKNYWDNVLYAEQLSDYSVWLAHWGINEPSMDCLIWQYTSDGVVEGVPSSRVDMNYWYGEISENNSNDNSNSDSKEDESVKYVETYSVGDVVNYDTIFVSSTSDEALKPTYTSGTITKIVEGARNPYLINNGTGWINNDCIIDSSQSKFDDDFFGNISEGDIVRFTGEVDYNGTHIIPYHNDEGYTVSQIDDDRVVLMYNGQVFAAVSICDIERI